MYTCERCPEEQHRLSDTVTITLLHYFSNAKFSQKFNFITVGLSVITYRHVTKYDLTTIFWPGPKVVTVSDSQCSRICSVIFMDAIFTQP